MAVYALGAMVPQIHESAFVHPDAVVIGRVVIGAHASVWPCATLRGDYGPIEIGARTSVQDGVCVHADVDAPTRIGDECVIGHLAHLEGCTVQDRSLIGAGAIVLRDVTVGSGSLIGAGALVPPGRGIPRLSKAVGVPARVQEGVVPEDAFADGVRLYVDNAERYRAHLRRIG